MRWTHYRMNQKYLDTKITMSQKCANILVLILLICLQDDSAKVCCFVLYLLDIRQIEETQTSRTNSATVQTTKG